MWPNKTGGNSIAEVIVEVTSYNGRPLSGYGVEFKAEPNETSGGHDSGHNEGRPKGKFTDNSICYTDNGQCEVKYTASEFGGTEKITAKLQSLRFEHIPSQSKELTVKVPGLGALGANQCWRLTGSSGTTNVTECQGEEIRHSKNHMATFSTAIRMAMTAKDYYDETDTTLGINDMSLPWGGLFDICSDWKKPHAKHREGKSVDISETTLDTNNREQNVNKRLLERIAGWYEGSRLTSRSLHFEFP